MAHQKRKVSRYRGRFFRNLGKHINSSGKLVPKKFLLGTDRKQAEVANVLLERLWEEVVVEHEQVIQSVEELGGRFVKSNLVTGEYDPFTDRDLRHGPVWRAEGLLIADAIRCGERQIAVPLGKDSPARYIERLHTLRNTYSVIAFVPASVAHYEQGQQALSREAEDHAGEARRIAQVAAVPVSTNISSNPSRAGIMMPSRTSSTNAS